MYSFSHGGLEIRYDKPEKIESADDSTGKTKKTERKTAREGEFLLTCRVLGALKKYETKLLNSILIGQSSSQAIFLVRCRHVQYKASLD